MILLFQKSLAFKIDAGALLQVLHGELAETIIKAKDMAWVRGKRGPEPVQFARMGSIGGDLAAMLIHMRRLFSWQGGNIDLAGGMQAQSETLGQDRILAAAANRTIQEYLHHQAMNKNNVNLTIDTVEGKKVMMFDGIPVHISDQILLAEALVSQAT